MVNTKFPKENWKPSPILMHSERVFGIGRYNFLKKSRLLITLMILFCIIAFSFQLDEVEKSWQKNGYTIVEDDDLKLVELSFEHNNIVSINIKTSELFVIAYLEGVSDKPTVSYIADVKKVLLNSSFSEQTVQEMVQYLSAQESWMNSFRVEQTVQVETFLYDQTTPVLKIITLEEDLDTNDDIELSDSNAINELEKELSKIKSRYREIESENQRLKAENQILVNKVNAFNQQIRDLKDQIGKYQNLSEYRDNTISGLKNTIDRYVEIERQKDQSIKDLKMEIALLEAEMDLEKEDYERTVEEMATVIESLKLSVEKQSAEIQLLKDTEQMYLSRIERLKSMNEQEFQLQQTDLRGQKPEEPSVDQPAKSSLPVEKSGDTVESTALTNDNQDEIENLISEKQKIGDNHEMDITEPDTESEKSIKQSPLLNTIIVYNNGVESHSIEHEYDHNGKLMKETVVLPDNKTVAFTETTYHENGKIKEKKTYENSQMTGKTVFQYDKTGRLVRIFFYDTKSMTHYSLFEYNEAVSENDPVKVKYYRDNQMNAFEENLFDQDGNLIKTIHKDSEGKIIATNVLEYSDEKPVKISSFRSGELFNYQIIHYHENGLQQSIETFDSKNALISTAVFIWDETQ